MFYGRRNRSLWLTDLAPFLYTTTFEIRAVTLLVRPFKYMLYNSSIFMYRFVPTVWHYKNEIISFLFRPSTISIRVMLFCPLYEDARLHIVSETRNAYIVTVKHTNIYTLNYRYGYKIVHPTTTTTTTTISCYSSSGRKIRTPPSCIRENRRSRLITIGKSSDHK